MQDTIDVTKIGLYDAETGILQVTTSGAVHYSDMIAGIDKMIALVREIKTLKILEDARGSTACFTIPELKAILTQLDEKMDPTCSVRHAVIHADPTATAYALMADKFYTSKSYTLAVFSTHESAKNWLENPNSH